MKNIFERSRARWIRYDKYEIREAPDGIRYITPARDAKPEHYNPLKCGETLVVDALNVGMMMMRGGSYLDPKVEPAILEFARKYGMLGFITGMPTTSEFMDYDYAYLNKNQFIRDEMMRSEDFAKLFFPFKDLDFEKEKIGAPWGSEDDEDMLDLQLSYKYADRATKLSVRRQYAEPYEWYALELKDYAFTFYASYYYYFNKGTLCEEECEVLRDSVRAFGGIAPTYYIELGFTNPIMCWRFFSLMNVIQMLLSFMLVDEENQLRMCKHCDRVFVSTRSNAAFCSPTCKNRYNVYKSRERKELEEE